MGLFFDEESEFAKLVHRLRAGFKAVESGEFVASEVIQRGVGIENINDWQVVAQADLVVGFVVRWSHLQDARAEFEIHRLVADDRQQGFHVGGEGAAHMESDECGVARVLRVHSHGGIRHDCLGAGGGNFQIGAGFFHDLDFVVVEKSFLVFRNDFLVAERCERDGAPVHHPLSTVDESLCMKIDKNLLHLACVGVVHRKALAGPVTGATKLLELVDDDAAVLFLPLPDAFEKLIAAEIVAGLFFLLPQFALHHGLRGDASVIRAWKPENLMPCLACPAGEDVLKRVVEHMSECENAGHIRRGDDNRVGGFWRSRVCGKETVFDPPGIPFIFDGLRFVGFVQFGHDARHCARICPRFNRLLG